MTEYFGFMVSEFDGTIENLSCNVEYKPKHESCGFSYAKWFTNETERDKCKEYTRKTIKAVQENRYKGLRGL